MDSILTDLISALPATVREHAPGSSLYALLRQLARAEVEKLFSGTGDEAMLLDLAFNDCRSAEIRNAAVSSSNWNTEFVRVVGNTTSSHLADSKANPYGELQRFPVPVHAAGPLLKWADLVKMDVEGHEKEIVLNTSRDHWSDTDAMMEVQSAENAVALYNHFSTLGVSMFSQKTGWQRVSSVGEVPTSYREGSLFVTRGSSMPWQESGAGEEGRP